MTLLYTDPLFLEHRTGMHPEQPGRLRAVTDRLAQAALVECCQAGTVQPADAAELGRTHSAELVEFVELVAGRGGGRIDADTVVSPRSYEVARHAAGTCAAAVSDVLAGKGRTALCLVRPPGHHATAGVAMGFCLFNNAAVAARRALAAGVSRVLLIDWDVHHGNGTQDVFYAEEAVSFVSLHRYGGGFYPGTGDVDETGTGAGLGWTKNVPLRVGTSPAEYHDRFRRAVEEAAARARPELVLLSAGFDAHRRDPIGQFILEADDYRRLTRVVLDVAEAHAGGRVVSCLEGGYNLDALAECVEAHLRELLGGAAQT